MDTDLIVKLVAEEVAKRLGRNAKPGASASPSPGGAVLLKKALVFFGGSPGLASDASRVVKALKDLPLEIRGVASSGACATMGCDYLANQSGITVVGPEAAGDSLALARDSDMVLIPILTQNTAARIALGLRDSLVSDVVAWTLMAGKPVLAARDAVGASEAEKKALGITGIAAPYRALLERHLEALRGLGVKVLDLEAFPAEVAALVAPREPGSGAGVFSKKALTREDLVRLAQSTPAQSSPAPGSGGARVILVAPGTIVTPLCRDMAREMGIAIEVRKVESHKFNGGR